MYFFVGVYCMVLFFVVTWAKSKDNQVQFNRVRCKWRSPFLPLLFFCFSTFFLFSIRPNIYCSFNQKLISRIKGSKHKIVNGQIFEKEANLGASWESFQESKAESGCKFQLALTIFESSKSFDYTTLTWTILYWKLPSWFTI